MVLSPTLIQHFPGVRLIVLWSLNKKCNVSIPIICTFKFWVEHHTHGVYTRWNKVGMLYELILQGMQGSGVGTMSDCFGSHASRDNL